MAFGDVSVVRPHRMLGHQGDRFAFDCHALEAVADAGFGGREAVACRLALAEGKVESIV